MEEIDIARFWDKVDIQGEDDCWNWKAGIIKSGYGEFSLEGKMCRAHIIAYILSNDDYDGVYEVLHTCHNKSCCNPHHLRLGTHTDNMRDSDVAKLNWSKVREIRQLYQARVYNQKELAVIYGVNDRQISNIILNKSWSSMNGN